MSDLNKLGTIAADIQQLSLNIEMATLTVRHADQDDISVYVNHVDHWEVTANGLQQIKMANRGINIIGGGTVVTGDLAGGVVIGGGSISIGGRSVVGRRISGGNISIINGEVFVNGRRISDQDNASTEPPQDPDVVEVVVPTGFSGGLDLTVGGIVNGSIDSWRGGNASFNFSGQGKIEAGPLTELTAFIYNGSGTAKLIVEKVDTQVAIISVSGTGDVDIDELVSLTVSITTSGTGDVSVSSGSAKSGSASSSGTGDIYMRGDFAAVTTRNTGLGDVRIRAAR
jgi:hypothetical protein